MKVFLNYRHDDSQGTAWAVYGQLQAHFGAENVFFDHGNLRSGDKWLREIKAYLAETDVLLTLIGPRWMSSLLDHRRTGDPDFVATEIDLALQAGLGTAGRLLPVLVDNADPPDPTQLPVSLKSLADHHCHRIRPTHLIEDTDSLMARAEEVVRSPGTPEVRRVDPTTSVAGQEGDPIPPATQPKTDGGSAAVAPRPDERHYEMVVDALENLIVFLGAGVNLDDHLPDDADLSRYLAQQAKLDAENLDLAEIAQWARTLRGEPRMFKWIRHLLTAGAQPAPVHRYLAHFPKRLEELGLEKSYQMIVTTKFDTALERSFREEHEPYDVAVYMGPGTPEEQQGRFVHLPWDGEPETITNPNSYDKLPISFDGELMRTVIVRIHGCVDDMETGFTWKDNYVITEDHYIEFLSGRSTEDLIPAQILAKLQESNCLFLGHSMTDWRLRVFLKRIWRGDKLGRAIYWAVERDPDVLEGRLWQDAGAQLYQSSLSDYVHGLDEFLLTHRDGLKV